MSVQEKIFRLIRRLGQPASSRPLLIRENVLRLIETEARRSEQRETGGVLAGTQETAPRISTITHASDSGPLATRQTHYFSRDTAYCQRILDEWARNSNGHVDYLGEWHKHMQDNPSPSVLDVKTMRSIARSRNYHVSEPLLVIIGRDNDRSSLRVFAINSSGAVDDIDWVATSDTSRC